jgi:hypothetical protein
VAGACPVLDLGGRTVGDPCEGLWCTLDDFRTVRDLLALEHNALVRVLNQWNQLVAAGRVKWTPVPTAAWAVYEESWNLLQKYPWDYASGWFDTDVYAITAPITAMIAMAGRVHSAACDVTNELTAVGESVASQPAPPKTDKGIAEQAVDAARELTGGAIKVVGLAVLGLLGYGWITSRR